MNKKGMTHEQVFMLIQIVIIAGVIAGMYIAADRVVNDSYFKRSILAKDLAFTINSVSSSPANIDMLYRPEANISGFDICFDRNLNLVKISEHEKASFASYIYFFPSIYEGRFGMASDGCIVYTYDFSLNRTGQSLFIYEDLKYQEKQKYVCRHLQESISSAKILLDPVKGYNEPGTINQEQSLSSYQVNNMIASSLNELLSQSSFIEVSRTRQDSEPSLSAEERISKNEETSPNITLSIDSSSISDSDYVFIYFNPDSEKSVLSSSLACVIANNIEESTGFQALAMPISPDSVYEDDARKSLGYSQNVNLFIEIGSVSYKETKIFEEYVEISQAISNGIQEYIE